MSEAVVAGLRPALSSRIRVIHNAVPDARADRRASRAHVLSLIRGSAKALVVSVVGSLHPIKGHLEVLAIAPDLLDRLRNVRLAFVGGVDPSTPEHARALRARVRELGIDQAVTFLRHRDDAATIITGSDLLLIPSVPAGRNRSGEGFSLVAAEAMACGVVAYAGGGPPRSSGHAACWSRRATGVMGWSRRWRPTRREP